LAKLVGPVQLSNPAIAGCDSPIQLDQFGLGFPNQQADQHVEVICGITCDLGKSPT
jgi:hypothetical protein